MVGLSTSRILTLLGLTRSARFLSPIQRTLSLTMRRMLLSLLNPQPSLVFSWRNFISNGLLLWQTLNLPANEIYLHPLTQDYLIADVGVLKENMGHTALQAFFLEFMEENQSNVCGGAELTAPLAAAQLAYEFLSWLRTSGSSEKAGVTV